MFLVLLTAAFSGVMAAEPSDPLEAPACREALAALDREEAQAHAAHVGAEPMSPAARARVQTARRAAALACLQGEADPPPPSRSAAPPISVPRIGAPPAARTEAPRLPTLGPISPPMPQTITTCDAIGCWTNDGTRLERAGPGLLGPRGFCTTTGSIVTCP